MITSYLIHIKITRSYLFVLRPRCCRTPRDCCCRVGSDSWAAAARPAPGSAAAASRPPAATGTAIRHAHSSPPARCSSIYQSRWFRRYCCCRCRRRRATASRRRPAARRPAGKQRAGRPARRRWGGWRRCERTWGGWRARGAGLTRGGSPGSRRLRRSGRRHGPPKSGVVDPVGSGTTTSLVDPVS